MTEEEKKAAAAAEKEAAAKAKKKLKVRVLESGGIDEGGKFYAKGETLEVTEARAEKLGNCVEAAK